MAKPFGVYTTAEMMQPDAPADYHYQEPWQQPPPKMPTAEYIAQQRAAVAAQNKAAAESRRKAQAQLRSRRRSR